MKSVNINIPVSHFSNILSWDTETINKLVQKSIEIACKIGIRLEDDHEGIYLKEAEKKGARIDWNKHAVKYCEEDINKTVDIIKKTCPLTKSERTSSLADNRSGMNFLVGNGANLLFDWKQWEARAPEREDLVKLCEWVQGSDDISSLFPPVMLKDIDQLIEPMYNYAILAGHCGKTIYHEQPTHPAHVKYLGKMARIVEKHTGFFQPMQIYEFVNPPFRLGLRAIETMLARVDTGECSDMGVGSMSVSGMSAPVTVAETAVAALAEILAALTFFRILRPGYGLKTNMCTGNLDMRTGRVSYCNMHSHLQNIAGWELITRGIGADSHFLTWYRDANEPGMQALYEFGMSQSFFSSVYTYCQPEIGGLCNGNIFSPEQAVMDMELVKEFNELTSGFEVDFESTAYDEIINAGFEQSAHLMTEHTIEHMRSNVPLSNFLLRGLPSGAHHRKEYNQTAELMEGAALSVRKAIEKGKEKKPDRELCLELYECVKEAACDLNIECPDIM